MNIHSLKLLLQNHLSDGLVLIVGSGLSCAEGLPGMGAIADHLNDQMANTLTTTAKILWDKIFSEISSAGLEAALLKNKPTSELEQAISKFTGNFIAEKEELVINDIFTTGRKLKFTKLLRHIQKTEAGISIITTNYDRLIELAIEAAGIGVDTMYAGHVIGQLNPKESQLSFCRGVALKNKKPVLTYQKRVLVLKPHGSLDWYLVDEKPVRYGGNLGSGIRLIITPGQNKFRNGYESPFDIHREKANKAIDQASRYLIVGYGFNDDHLETHLMPAIKNGRPTLLLTRTLSDQAKSLALDNPNVITLDYHTESGIAGTRVIHQKAIHFFPTIQIWDIENFIQEVLEP